MPLGVEANIFRALSDRLQTLVFTPALSIAWPNIPFPAAGQQMPNSYIEVIYLPNRTNTRTLANSGHQQHRGIFQVSLHMNKAANTGMRVPLEKADQIVAHFPLGLVLHESGIKVKIYRKPYQIPQPPRDGWLTVPVTIEYEAYA
ncbi:phage tail terminator-like protein [Neorhizobium sp. S3-V5DH]|uniref:phage tail terminator-like protein n=1 Tax=Neorhizobium sp. S3-V5DH TaxID=2485166 RepID=UPI001048ABD8|nr:phage tail terminator-like protein [Neorhizobium sp. S3-V5DH]TCV66279.1 uncharacterized protein DUF4128 [Neorhizobium sp. S3-V5DH]